ncbi:MAG: succinyl-diaminopimelate desuccinylase [Deltaproteobacteria bacterium]|nr:MAG: succinyl-diaminopimelate desuccinylase [Deltaproteobacteria bacterium]
MEIGERLARLTLELVRVPSVYGDEARLCDLLEQWGREVFGASALRRIGNALVCGWPAEGRPTVALVGHLDTVPPHEADPPPRIDGGRVVGLGASDMKSGIAVALTLAEDLDLEALPFGLMLVLYDKEEGPHEESGLLPVLDSCPDLTQVDLAIVQEPTDGVLQVGCVGSIHATLTFRGRSAHSARPWHGENAIHKAGALLAELEGRAPEEREVGGHCYREVFSVTQAQGGRYRNVVPDQFTLNLNYRFAPGRSLAEAKAQVEALVAGRAEIQYTDLAPAGAVPAGEPLFEHFVSTTGLEVAPKQAWTDVARLSEAGIPAVNFGPGLTAQAHQAGEYCEIAQLTRCYQALRRFLETPLP